MRRSLVGLLIIVLIGWRGAEEVVRAYEPPDPRAPARFTMEVISQDGSDLVWSEAEGYREASLANVTFVVGASDPRIGGTVTMSATVRQFGPRDEPDEAFDVVVGNARIDNARGAWVGTFDGFGPGGASDARMQLAGTGAYEGLTAFIRMEELDGVIFDGGLPPVPEPVEAPTGETRPTAPPGPTPSATDRTWILLPDWPAPPGELRSGRSLGDSDAPIRMEVYQDPQCSHCARFAEDIEPRLVAGPIAAGEVFLTYRDLAILGPESLEAAVAMRVAEALGGRFWDYERILFHNQGGVNRGAFSRERLADIAEAVGLDRDVFLAEMEDPVYAAAVGAEGAAARALGIQATPTLVINGTIVVGLPTWEEMLSAIEAASMA